MRAFIWYKDIENPSSSLWDTKVFLKIFEVIWIMIHDPDQNLKDHFALPNGRCIMWENFRKICPAVLEELSVDQVATIQKIIIPMKKQTEQKQ